VSLQLFFIEIGERCIFNLIIFLYLFPSHSVISSTGQDLAFFSSALLSYGLGNIFIFEKLTDFASFPSLWSSILELEMLTMAKNGIITHRDMFFFDADQLMSQLKREILKQWWGLSLTKLLHLQKSHRLLMLQTH